MKLGLPFIDYNERTCILVIEVPLELSFSLIGVVVDSVAEVLNISPDSISPAPSFGTKLDTTFILGLAQVKGKIKTLIAIDQLLTAAELVLLGDKA